MLGNYLKLKTKTLLKPCFNLKSFKFFSGGHDHSHSGNVEDVYHERKFNRISYNKKLTESEREK